MTDVMLPLLSGTEIAATLKSDALTSEIPIIALTARSFGASDRWMDDAPWDAFLTKPCLPEELVATVKSLLYDRARVSSRSLRAAGHA
jgi:DNA-binding response OmpR family regulator